MGLIDDRELNKQASEVRAWVDIARQKGSGFMTGAVVDGDLSAYEDKVIVDVGCGPRPFVEHFPARLGFMIDCCMFGYQEEGLLQPETIENVCCVDAMAERLPLADSSVDILFSINMLDHTFDPAAVTAEFRRVLKPEGMFHLHVDLGGEPNECEPVVFDEALVEELCKGFRVIHGSREAASNPGRDARLLLIMVLEEKGAAPTEDPDGGPKDYLDVLVSPDDGGRLTRDGDRLSSKQGATHEIRDGIWDLRPRT